MRNNRIRRVFCLFICILLFLTGCVAKPSSTMDGLSWDDGWVKIGNILGVDAPGQLELLESKEELAGDGLYYATWGTGSAVPFENSEGDTVDLYDAQLYFLASETKNEEEAQKSCDAWLSVAEENYEVQTKETVVCNGQSYTLLTYHCVGEDTPYDRGVSAFGVCGVSAVCAELTCLESYNEDLTALLTEFLNGCHYIAD